MHTDSMPRCSLLMQYAAPTQTRIRSASPRSNLATMCGSARWARVMPARSMRPSEMACLAEERSVIRVACSTGRSTASLTAAATPRCGMSGVPEGGIAFDRPSSVASDGPATFRKSSRPEVANLTAISRLSSRLRPPGWSSSPIMRMPTSRPSPIAERTASRTSIVKRSRLVSEPPYSSVRRFTRGVQNWSIRWLVATSSMPSRPAASARRAAVAKSATTRRMSECSICFGQNLCIGSRTGDGAMVGNQSPSFDTVRRPMWVSWLMMAAPWPWIRSTMAARGSRMASVPKSNCPQREAESRDTLDEPPTMVRPMPPRAFSSW